MVLLSEMPKSGQFIAIWRSMGRTWASTYQIDSEMDILYEYDCYMEGFRCIGPVEDHRFIWGDDVKFMQ